MQEQLGATGTDGRGGVVLLKRGGGLGTTVASVKPPGEGSPQGNARPSPVQSPAATTAASSESPRMPGGSAQGEAPRGVTGRVNEAVPLSVAEEEWYSLEALEEEALGEPEALWVEESAASDAAQVAAGDTAVARLAATMSPEDAQRYLTAVEATELSNSMPCSGCEASLGRGAPNAWQANGSPSTT